MALIACPDCGREVSDAAPACIHCGRPLGALVVSGPERAVAQAAHFVCARCGSDDVRKLSVVYASGSSLPPTKRKLSLAPFRIGLAIAGLALAIAKFTRSLNVVLFGWILAAIVSAVMAYIEHQENQEFNDLEYPDLKRKWDRSMICQQCGRVFELDALN